MARHDEYDLVVRSGSVVLQDGLRNADIGIRAGRIAAVEEGLTNAKQVIDASGKLVLPGCIDPHTHMGIPIKDTWSADDFSSGSVAAAFGGTTTVFDFTVQDPGQTLQASITTRLGRAQGKSQVDFGLHVNITDQPTEHLAEISSLIEKGFNRFKAFTTYKEQGMMMEWPDLRRVMETIGAQGGLLLLHCEDNNSVSSLTARHQIAGHKAPIYHARSRTAEAEALAIEKAAQIAGQSGTRLYIVHISSKLGLQAALRARRQGVEIYLETCPQYLVLDESKYLGKNGHYWIATPPLRRPEDSQALWEAVQDGSIDTIGTDHCPFTKAQKDRHGGAFDLTPNGIPGVENRLAILYTWGVCQGRISLHRMIELLCGNVARIFAIDDRKGSIAVGKDADLVVWDPAPSSLMTAADMHGNADFTPYQGIPQSGGLDCTILRGQPLVRNGAFVGNEVRGNLVLGTE